MYKKTAIIIIIVLAVVIAFVSLSSQNHIITQTPTEITVNEYTQETEVYFCPADGCEGEMVKFLQSAEESIHCALFDLELESLINIFDSKSELMDVKIVADDRIKDELDKKYIIFDTSSQLSHNKFCVVDGKKLFTGSTNPTYNGVNRNNNNLVLVYSEKLAKNYEYEFAELWLGQYGKGETNLKTRFLINGDEYENYFCPEDNCRERVKEEILAAEKSIYFMTFSFTDDGIATDLVYKFKTGVDVKGVFEKSQAGSEYSKYQLLDYQGTPVKKDTNGGMMHHKVFIIDNRTVITGSYNPTKSGNSKNDENILIIHSEEIAKEFVEEFNRIWAVSE